MRICLSAPNTLVFPEGGHLWVFLNWAMGFQSLGHEVIWLDVAETDAPEQLNGQVDRLLERLQPFGLDGCVATCSPAGDPVPHPRLRPLEEALDCDLLCNLRYNLPSRVLGAFRRSMLVDIDPGQFQKATELGIYSPGEHTSYFTIGEWANFPRTRGPTVQTLGKQWHYTPPVVALDAWPVTEASPSGAMTTVSGWYMPNQWFQHEDGTWYDNSKRAAFEPLLQLPQESPVPLELALDLGGYEPEMARMRQAGWRIRDSREVGHPLTYRRYIQDSLGEFSCAKPVYVNLQTGWLSDRTACYLASGKPVVIQKTGPSAILPDEDGVFRFDDPQSAARHLRRMMDDYPAHCRAARAIAETYLDARRCLTKVLECAL